MTLRTVAVPDPPAGEDWVTVVPGQYIYDVTGITATLTTTPGPLSTLHDRSGNNLDGSYLYSPAQTVLEPGFFAGANKAHWYNTFTGPQSRGETNAVACDISDVFSFDCWYQGDAAADEFDPFIAFSNVPFIAILLSVKNDGTIVFEFFVGAAAASSTSAAGTFPFDGNGHHLGVSYNGTAGAVYLDGALVVTVNGGVGGTAPGTVTNAELGHAVNAPAPATDTFMGQPAFYQSVLSAGRFAAHNAAGTSLAAYSAAVLADTPSVYYALDDETVETGRQVALEVTDGMTTVDLIPTGFPDVATPGPYEYSWQPLLPASTQTPNGRLTAVAIPRLVIPAGYTIGSHTVDIDADTQWSNITVWWSDSFMDGLHPIQPYAYPPGVLLLSRYATRSR